ncbi:MAG: TAXI family TRAP transporter solute-binding subunit [bacterium]
MRKIALAVLVVFVSLAAAPGRAPAAEKLLSFATARLGGSWAGIGAGLAKMFTDKIPGVIVKAESTGGGVANNKLVGSGQSDIGLTVERLTFLARIGKGPYKKKKFTDNRLLLSGIQTGVLQIATLEGSGIKTLGDLKGKRVSAGPARGGGVPALKFSLLVHGMSLKSFKVSFLNYSQGKSALVDGNVDAALTYAAVPVPALKELQAGRRKWRLVAIKEDKVKAIKKKFKGYFRVLIPKKAYGLAQDTVTIGARNALIVNAKLSNKLVYQLIKVIDQNLDEVKKIHPSLKGMNRKIFAHATVPIPYHPGALRYYKEAGLGK